MGLIFTTLTLSNPVKASLKPIDVNSMVDTGASHLCIPEHIAIQLELTELEKREVRVADGSIKLCSYMGPIKVHFENRSCFTGALVIGDVVLLGSIPMEDLDILINPKLQKVVVNPTNPNIASAVVM